MIPEFARRLNSPDFARAVKQARAASGLSQPGFASRFHIGIARLNWEQARTAPDPVGAAYVQTILFDHATVERALGQTEAGK